MTPEMQELRELKGFAYFWWWRFWLEVRVWIGRILHRWAPRPVFAFVVTALACIGELRFPACDD
jgi:hypothetical protein